MKYLMKITLDENDADYIKDAYVVDEDTKKKVEYLLGRVKGMERQGDIYSAEPEEMYPELTKDEIERINDLIPYREHGTHTIESIQFFLLADEGEGEEIYLDIRWNHNIS